MELKEALGIDRRICCATGLAEKREEYLRDPDAWRLPPRPDNYSENGDLVFFDGRRLEANILEAHVGERGWVKVAWHYASEDWRPKTATVMLYGRVELRRA